uniref:AlNc14C39G3358 protein n=1 Tax=Albugo laibachii Nc14 TaxID=890382 RepID=F0W991_9STRA|nr:AlNc14C39G3358 [Albugo laibachii Nc14]CCA18350.1 AlNc14C49G3883 [Albugo laibachii Nc14]|eukprot:CCA18350.1 AlNc14C49G3883 [Albugo laibachii Nc14]
MSERVTKLFLHGREAQAVKCTKTKKDVSAAKHRNKGESNTRKVSGKKPHKRQQFSCQTNGKQTNDLAKKLMKANVKKLHQSVTPKTIQLMKEILQKCDTSGRL